MSFCAAICGTAYVDNGCPWHAQKRQAGPVIFGQHAHVLAHPLRFHTVIGDESPIGAFLHEWSIPGRAIVPEGIDPSSAIAPLLCTLDALSRDATSRAGTSLLDLLGGAQRVLDVCEAFSDAPDAILEHAAPLVPTLQAVEDAERAGYFHVPALVTLLRQEARAQLESGGCAGRVIVSDGRLILLQRRATSQHLPPHVLWLDATASTRLYEVVFGRRALAVDAMPALQGTVHQVWSRANAKSYCTGDAAIRQLGEQVRTIMSRGYRRAALITYREIAGKVAPGLPALHFYAARGTNAFEDCDGR